MEMMSYRSAVLAHTLTMYETEPDYPWQKWPDYAVLRHRDNRKWYGLLMTVKWEQLGVATRKKNVDVSASLLSRYQVRGSYVDILRDSYVDILNVKCDPNFIESIRGTYGFLPAYHMNRKNWVSILLDGSVDKETIFSLLDMSYELTKK